MFCISLFRQGGALITAEFGFQHDREIFAVPGFINYPSFRGCNKLIRESKAKLVLTGKDIADEFLWERKLIDETVPGLNPEEKKILSLLGTEKNLDDLIIETGLSAGIILAVLANLEVKDLIFEISGGWYKGR